MIQSRLQSSLQKSDWLPFFAEHDISYRTVDHLPELMTNYFPDSEIAKGIILKRTKCAAILKNVIGKEKSNMVRLIQCTSFSLLTNESTDIATDKAACVLVKYCNFDSQQIETKMLSLTNVFMFLVTRRSLPKEEPMQKICTRASGLFSKTVTLPFIQKMLSNLHPMDVT